MQTINFERPSWPDDTIYFLTDATFLHYPYFRTDEQKEIVLNQIIKLNKELEIPISAYSIAVNHYHIKFYLPKGKNLSEIKQILRGGISFNYRKQFDVRYNEMWQTRKILQVWKESVNWKITGYIAGNLLKHKEVSTFQELKENRFSSFRYLVDRIGEDAARDLVYQVIECEEDSWGVVDVSKL